MRRIPNVRCAALAAIAAGLALMAAGCATTAAAPVSGFQSRVIEAAAPEEVIAAAKRVLREEFGRVSESDGGERLVSAPREFSTTSESGTARDLYGGSSRMRRLAIFNAGGSSRGGALARLRVEVQRLDTERRAALAPEEYRLNAPTGVTPIQTDAGVTARQGASWTFVRRDAALERALLDQISEQLGEASASPASAPAAEPAPQ